MINIIIPVHNRLEYTLACINSLKKQDCIREINIFIVDDGSTDETRKTIKKKFSGINILEGDGSLFWGGSINFGIKNVLKICNKGDWILLINNDIELESDAISNLVRISESKNRKVISGSLSVNFNDKQTIIKSGTIVKSWFLNLTSHIYEGLKLKDIRKNSYIKVDFLTGRCLLHPVEIFAKVGNYDSKRFQHYGADDEFSMRVKKFGYSTLVCLSSVVYLKENPKIFLKKNIIERFFDNFLSIKSSSNIINKFKLTIKVVPTYAKITFFLIGILKSLFIFLKNEK
jgi:GT2 family glycosyltransferase